MQVHCPCGKAELVEPALWSPAEVIGLAEPVVILDPPDEEDGA
jgi:hypothetical protein